MSVSSCRFQSIDHAPPIRLGTKVESCDALMSFGAAGPSWRLAMRGKTRRIASPPCPNSLYASTKFSGTGAAGRSVSPSASRMSISIVRQMAVTGRLFSVAPKGVTSSSPSTSRPKKV